MRCVPLGELVTIRGGGTPSRENPAYWGGAIPWASVKDFKTTVIASTAESITEAGLANSASNLIPPGAIIVPTRMAVGKAAINAVAIAINQDLKALLPSPSVIPRYLLHTLLTRSDDLERRATGATVKGITLDVLRELVVELPPLDEQRRIADTLDAADALRAKRRAALAKLDDLATAIFVEMFGKLRTNERGWPMVPVSSFVREFQGGRSLDADADAKNPRNRILKVSAVTSGTFRPLEAKPLPDGYDPPPSHFVRKGDLLFSRANTTDLVGAVAHVQEDPDALVLPDKLWRFVWHEPQAVDPLFVWALFQDAAIREAISRRATGTSGSMKNISQGKLMAMPVPLPPYPLQQSFAERLRAVQALTAQARKGLDEMEKLFAALQHRAFAGAA